MRRVPGEIGGWLAVVVALAAGLPWAPVVAAEPPAGPADDLSWIRGANYTPSYAPNPVITWHAYDGEVIDRELGYARKLGLNSVRVHLNWLVYQHNPSVFMERLEDFVARCDRHDIRPMLILFDGCFGTEPSLDTVTHWVANPGPSRTSETFYEEGDRYVREVCGRFRGDRRVLMWDVMNEPDSTWLAWRGPEERQRVWAFVRHFLQTVREADPTHPCTVGITHTDNSHLVDLVDVLSMHSYATTAGELEQRLDETAAQSRAAGKPWLITECGAPGWGCDYEAVMPVLRRRGVGYYFWELMIGSNEFAHMGGVLYPDGTVRRLSHLQAITGQSPRGWKEKPDDEGVPIQRLGPGKLAPGTFARIVEGLSSTPTTRDNLQSRISVLQRTAVLESRSDDIIPWILNRAPHPVAAEIQSLANQSRWDEAIRRTDESLGQLQRRLSQASDPPGR